MAAYLAGMGTEWAVVTAADQVTLDAHNSGDITFTVSNPGTATDTVVFDILPGEGTQRSWFTVKEPQRTVKPSEAVSYRVKVTVPAGTPAGRYDLQGMAYSASSAPEESSRTSGRVSFELATTAKAAPKRWPILAAAGALVLVVIGAVAFVLRPSAGDTEPAAGPGPSASPSSSPFVITGSVRGVLPSASKKSSTAPTVPDVRGKYRGTTVRKSDNDTTQVVITLVQDGTKLTGSLKDLAHPEKDYFGSGTVTVKGAVTLKFDLGVTVIMDGTIASPGRLKGTYKGEGSSQTAGTWDVCTCAA